MKLYFHRAIIYIMAGVWPKLFLRYCDDYYKRYVIEFLSKVKKDNSEKTQPDAIIEKRKRCDCDRERKTCTNCKGWYDR